MVYALIASDESGLGQRPPGPLLVRPSVAVPDLDLRAVVRGGCDVLVEATAIMLAADRAVGVDEPLLIVPAVAGPDLHLSSVVRRRRHVGVEAAPVLRAADRVIGVVVPPLIVPAVAAPGLHFGPVVRGRRDVRIHAPPVAGARDPVADTGRGDRLSAGLRGTAELVRRGAVRACN